MLEIILREDYRRIRRIKLLACRCPRPLTRLHDGFGGALHGTCHHHKAGAGWTLWVAVAETSITAPNHFDLDGRAAGTSLSSQNAVNKPGPKKEKPA